MNRIAKLTSLCLLILAALAGQAQAGVILDFESLSVDNMGTNDVGDEYVESGFSLVGTTTGLGDGRPEFARFGTIENRFTGSTALFSNSREGLITLSEVDGSAFSLDSIDLAELTGNDVASTTFVGELLGGGTTSQTFTLDGIAFEPETFLFNDSFNSVTSVTWTQANPFHQFDNIAISEAVSNSVVPEPTSIATFGMLFGFAALRRRRRLN